MPGLILPTDPGPRVMTPRFISARGETRPASSGPVTRNLRPGTRSAWDIEMPPLSYPESLAFDDLLSEHETVVMEIQQPDLDTGEPGSPQIDGSGQAGMTLNLKGLAIGYALRKGQWLSFQVAGQWYAYKARAAVTVGADGRAAVPLRTMLRRPPSNNAAVAIKQPLAEGYATVDPDSLTVSAEDRMVRLRFTLEERD